MAVNETQPVDAKPLMISGGDAAVAGGLGLAGGDTEAERVYQVTLNKAPWVGENLGRGVPQR